MRCCLERLNFCRDPFLSSRRALGYECIYTFFHENGVIFIDTPRTTKVIAFFCSPNYYGGGYIKYQVGRTVHSKSCTWYISLFLLPMCCPSHYAPPKYCRVGCPSLSQYYLEFGLFVPKMGLQKA